MTTILDLGKLRFYWAGDYVITTQYELNDVVKYGGNVYVYTNVVKTIGNLPTDTAYWALMVKGVNFVGVWDPAVQYHIGDAVAYGAVVYVSLSDNINKEPDLYPAIWSTFVTGIQYNGVYSNTTAYQPDDVVTYGPSAYIAIQTTTGHDPTNATYWSPFVSGIAASGVYNSATAYVPNNIVAYGANLYIATANTTGNLPTNTAYWQPFISAFQNRGAWVTSTTYYVNDLVQYGANTYACQVQNVSGVFATDLAAGKWSIFVSGLRQRGAWTTATQYLPYDIVVYGGNTYSCVTLNTSGVFATDLAAGKWQIFNGGIRWRGTWAAATQYLVNDVVYNLTSSYICLQDNTSSSNFNTDLTAGEWQIFAAGNNVFPAITSGQNGYSLSIANDGINLAWLNATSGVNILYVAKNGSDSNPGNSLALPKLTIQGAIAAVPSGQKTAIFVKSGTYQEALLPMVVPPNCAIVGDATRTTIVQPGSGLAADGVTPNNQATMWALSDGSLLNKLSFQGMTGWVPGATPSDITTSTPKGIYCALNPASPIIVKSPYVIECACFSSGGIGAYVNGSVHSSGNRSILFHEFTGIHDNGVGIWVDNNGKSECVGVFTYYAYFGYATTNGGQLRSISGNNSYGTYGSVSSGYSAAETAITGSLYGTLITFTGNYTGTINPGDTVSNGAGVTATVTNVQISSVYVTNVTGGTFTAGQTITATSGGVGIVSTYGGQQGYVLVLNNLIAAPQVGQSVQVAGDSSAYIINATSGSWVNSSSVISVVLAQQKATASASGSTVTIRSNFSLCRITAHDFLNIGTGGITTTNYPNTPTQAPNPANQVLQTLPGRVYYISADQAGNFQVGSYFAVNQATGAATLNANSFNLSGLTSLRLGSIGAQLGAQINEFSTDGTMAQNSPVKVPTQSAVVTYVGTQVSAAVPSQTGNSGKYLTTNGTVTSWGTVSVTPQWTVTTAATTAVAGTNYLCNTASSPFTITLPASPNNNDSVKIADANSTFGVNPVTVGYNGASIQGSGQNLILNVSGASVNLTYNSSFGWRLV